MKRLGLLLIVLLLSGCSQAADRDQAAVLIDLRQTSEDLEYTHHLLLYNRKTTRSAVLLIPGDLIPGDADAGIRENRDAAALRRDLGALLNISITDYVEIRDDNGAKALFAILDSLAAEQTELEVSGDQRMRLRWQMLYAHAGILASEQVIENVYAAVSPPLAHKQVKRFLEENGKASDGRKDARLIAFPIDMNGKALYDGAYAEELVADIMRELGRKNL
jgi:hypothetical protein